MRLTNRLMRFLTVSQTVIMTSMKRTIRMVRKGMSKFRMWMKMGTLLMVLSASDKKMAKGDSKSKPCKQTKSRVS